VKLEIKSLKSSQPPFAPSAKDFVFHDKLAKVLLLAITSLSLMG